MDSFGLSRNLSEISDACVYVGLINKAMEICKEIEDNFSKAKSPAYIARALALNSKEEAIDFLKESLELLESLETEKNLYFAYSDIIVAITSLGYVEEAIKILNYIKNVSDRIYILPELAETLIRMEAYAQAFEIITEMRLNIKKLMKDKDTSEKGLAMIGLSECIKNFVKTLMNEKPN